METKQAHKKTRRGVYGVDFAYREETMTNILLWTGQEARKNPFVQYHAFLLAKRVNPKLTLNTNAITDQPQQFINNIGPYLPRDKYNHLIKNSRIALQAYLCESFCYQTLETIYLGCLPIISPCIKDNLKLPEELMVRNLDSPLEISRKILDILIWSDGRYKEVLAECQKRLDTLTEGQNKYLKAILEHPVKK